MSPVMLCLQSRGMNVIQAFNVIEISLNTLKCQLTYVQITDKFNVPDSKLEYF